MSKRVNNKKGNNVIRRRAHNSHPSKARAADRTDPKPQYNKGILNLFSFLSGNEIKDDARHHTWTFVERVWGRNSQPDSGIFRSRQTGILRELPMTTTGAPY